MASNSRLLFFLLSFCYSKGSEIQNVYVKRVECSVNPDFIFANYSCYAKSFNRSCSTATVIISAKTLMQPIYVIQIIFFFNLNSSFYFYFFFQVIINLHVSLRADLSTSFADATFQCLQSPSTNRPYHKASYSTSRIDCARSLQAMSKKRNFLFFSQIFLKTEIICLWFFKELTFKERPIPTDKLLDIYPSGEYRFLFYLIAVNGDSMVNITADAINTSSDKNVFG